MSFVELTAPAKLDRKTKDLVKRLESGDIAIIDHADIDRVSAEELVEAGVRVVTVAYGFWDTHGGNFKYLKDHLPLFDTGVSALVEDVYARGLDEDVTVCVWGEFGRTPKINKDAGRDHWPGAMSVLYAGGGLKMGQAIGTTDSTASYPASKPYTPGCVLSTMYSVVGIDHKHVFHDDAKRPLPVLSEGDPIKELVGDRF